MIDLISVDSSSIDAVGYDADSRELYVRFRASGETYVYYAVDEWIFQELLLADSKGAYVNTAIKAHFHCAKVI